MPISFQCLLENMSQHHKRSEEKAMDAIRTGINIRENFWDDFLLVINNSDAMSELLDVPAVKVSSWHNRVRAVLNKVQQTDAVPDPDKKSKTIPTGDNDSLFVNWDL